jgi:glutathione S-transferase
MSALLLVVGTRNYSSWSLRPWMLLRHLDLEFTVRQIHFDTPEFEAELPKLSPTRRVPGLIHGASLCLPNARDLRIHLRARGRTRLARGPARRAIARSVAAEMHSGFAALRSAAR